MTRSRGYKVVSCNFSFPFYPKKMHHRASSFVRVPFFFCFFFFERVIISPLSSPFHFFLLPFLSLSLKAFCQTTKRKSSVFFTQEQQLKTHSRLKTLSKHTRAGFTRAVEWHWPFLEEQQQREQYSRRRFPPRWKEEEEEDHEFYQQQGKR